MELVHEPAKSCLSFKITSASRHAYQRKSNVWSVGCLNPVVVIPVYNQNNGRCRGSWVLAQNCRQLWMTELTGMRSHVDALVAGAPTTSP